MRQGLTISERRACGLLEYRVGLEIDGVQARLQAARLCLSEDLGSRLAIEVLDSSGQAFWQGLVINLGLFIILTVSLNLTSGFTGVFSLGGGYSSQDGALGTLDLSQNNFLGKGYQLSHSLIAFGRGEWFGVGLGASVEKLLYLPEAHTDFLLAVLAAISFATGDDRQCVQCSNFRERRIGSVQFRHPVRQTAKRSHSERTVRFNFRQATECGVVSVHGLGCG